MTAKTWIIVGIVIVCLVIFIFGKETMSYFHGARQYANTSIKDSIPPEFEIARLKSMLTRLDSIIERRREALVEMQIQAENLEKEVKHRKTRLIEDRSLLARVADILAKKRDTYVIGDLSYSYAEIDADAVIKASRFKQDKDMLTIREETLAEFPVAINEARKTISDGEIERQRLANDVEQLALRAERYKTISQLDAGKDAAGRTLGKSYADIQKSIAELGLRLEKGERILTNKRAVMPGINYAVISNKKSGLDALREALQ